MIYWIYVPQSSWNYKLLGIYCIPIPNFHPHGHTHDLTLPHAYYKTQEAHAILSKALARSVMTTGEGIFVTNMLAYPCNTKKCQLKHDNSVAYHV